MVSNLSAVAIIPARGGSKRIKNKNIKDFCGRSIISWPIFAAKKSGCFRDVIVSTDCEAIAAVSVGSGASVPSLRDPSISDDFSPVSEVVQDAILSFGLNDDLIVLLYATAAGVLPEDLTGALEALRDNEAAQFVLGVCEFPHPPQRGVRLVSGRIEVLEPRMVSCRTQDLEVLYHDAAQFVVGRRSAWLAGETVWTAKTLGHVLPSSRAVDIDVPDDWLRAERLLSNQLLDQEGLI